jgi:hypothetical protein
MPFSLLHNYLTVMLRSNLSQPLSQQSLQMPSLRSRKGRLMKRDPNFQSVDLSSPVLLKRSSDELKQSSPSHSNTNSTQSQLKPEITSLDLKSVRHYRTSELQIISRTCVHRIPSPRTNWSKWAKNNVSVKTLYIFSMDWMMRIPLRSGDQGNCNHHMSWIFTNWKLSWFGRKMRFWARVSCLSGRPFSYLNTLDSNDKRNRPREAQIFIVKSWYLRFAAFYFWLSPISFWRIDLLFVCYVETWIFFNFSRSRCILTGRESSWQKSLYERQKVVT